MEISPDLLSDMDIAHHTVLPRAEDFRRQPSLCPWSFFVEIEHFLSFFSSDGQSRSSVIYRSFLGLGVGSGTARHHHSNGQQQQ
jgi:hypothetical protein